MENYCRKGLEIERISYLLSIHYYSEVKRYQNKKRANVTNLYRVRTLTAKNFKIEISRGVKFLTGYFR